MTVPGAPATPHPRLAGFGVEEPDDPPAAVTAVDADVVGGVVTPPPQAARITGRTIRPRADPDEEPPTGRMPPKGRTPHFTAPVGHLTPRSTACPEPNTQLMAAMGCSGGYFPKVEKCLAIPLVKLSM